jgi:hypothetical protein
MADGFAQLLAYGLAGLRASHARHEHVHQHHIERRLLEQLKGLRTTGGVNNVSQWPNALAHIAYYL